MTAAAAYRSGEKIADERQGVVWDFTRKRGVLHAEIVLPSQAPAWASDRAALWNAAERAEDTSTRRAIAKTARDFRIALPHELTADERLAVTRDFARFLVDRYGAAVDLAIHAPDRRGDDRNFHAHLLMTTRALGAEGFGAKLRSLDSPKTSGPEMEAIREGWETIANRALEAGGHEARIDRRSFDRQGIDQEPTVHVGVAATAMERNGEATERGDLNREIEARNAERDRLKAEAARVEAQIIDLDAERAKREEAKAIRAEAKTLDPDRILASLTERRATFSRADLNRALTEFLPEPKARSAFTDELLGREGVVPLREDEKAPVSRYTTRVVLDAEGQVAAAADRMRGRQKHAVSAAGIQAALDAHPMLDGEQRAALDHATRGNGLAMIAGEAGTGKSTTFAAIRDAYEADGFTVKGLSWTNAVTHNLKRDGFRDTSTIAAELMRQKSGRGSTWNSRTVLMVDEAGMLSTRHLAAFLNAAAAAGAKVVLAGDGRQLGSIEHGGMLDTLQRQHGAAELHTVRRVGDAEQRSAFNAMHRGDFKSAVQTFDRQGAIHWSADPESSRAALVAAWARDTAADPGKTRFALAFTNAEVDDLNARMRAVRKERGELGDDHTLPTATGPQTFAVGDRVIFAASGRTKSDRDRGFFNGSTGTVSGIEDGRMTVTLDGAKGDRARSVSFTVGTNADAGEYGAIKHNLAGTVYKAQGRTLDQSYVLHSDQWRSATSYVALSRHRERTAIFATEKASPWVMAEGGLDSLSDHQRARAQESYAAWAEAKPDLARRYGLADYVGYVQAQWAEEKRLSPLDRLAQQMGRIEERRAASDFVQGARPAPAATEQQDAPAKKPPLSLVARIVGDYLELCYSPTKDWVRWIAEDLKHKAAVRRARLFNEAGREHGDTERPRAAMDDTDGIRSQPLHELPRRLDAHGADGRADGLPSRPGAGAGRDDALRPVRAEGRIVSSGSASDTDTEKKISGKELLAADLAEAKAGLISQTAIRDDTRAAWRGRDRPQGQERS